MDEATRRREREAISGGATPVAVARAYLREGRPEDALAALPPLARVETKDAAPVAAPDDDPEQGAVRATCLLALGRAGEAADAAGAALAAAPGVLGTAFLEALTASLAADPSLARGADPIARLVTVRRLADLGEAAAEVLAPSAQAGFQDADLPGAVGDAGFVERALAARVPSLAEALRDDPSPLVRYAARGAPPLPPFPRESQPTRLFSAHGPDFELATPFVGFLLSMEARLTYLHAPLFTAIDWLLGPGTRIPAFGLGYGLAVRSGDVRGEVDERARALDAARVLLFRLTVGSGQPFDDLRPDPARSDAASLDEVLARRIARDLTNHPPARRTRPALRDAPHVRLLTRFHLGAQLPADASALLADARGYSAVGQRALERFVDLARDDARRIAERAALRDQAGGRERRGRGEQ